MEGGEKPEEASTVARSIRAESEPISELEPGGSIGRYQLLSRLGAGAMGVVWCARDPQLDRKVAIKVVHGKLSRSSEASQRLLREARAMAKLSHRAVVTVHDAGETDGRLFLAMELVEGTTLGHMLRIRTEDERRDWRKWLRMMLDAGRGLEAAHQSGILHRDFKPYNVLVDNTGRVCVADFGLATLGDDPVTQGGRATKLRLDLTMTGAVLGTPAYMSLQQLRGEPIDARADQFSFCVALYEALYGQRPFTAHGVGWEAIDSLEDAIEARGILPPPADSQVPTQVFEVLQRGLAASPEKRWASMSALLFALERARDGKRTDAHITIPDLPQQQSTQQRWLLVGLGAAALMVMGLIVYVLARDATPKTVERTPKRLFDVPLKTKLAATPDGKRLLLVTDRLEVRDLGGAEPPRIQLLDNDVAGISLTDHEVVFGQRGGNVSRWRYLTDAKVERIASYPAAWFGETVAGYVLYQGAPGPLQIVEGNKVVHQWPIPQAANVIAVSPDRKRVAVLEADRFYGEIVVRDVTQPLTIRSQRLENPTALAWQDDHTLVYATGAGIEPTISRVRLEGDHFTKPEQVYRQDIGWFSELAIGGSRMFAIEMAPKSRARVVDTETHSSNELDASTVGAALAWLDSDAYLIWNRNTKRVERRTSNAVELTSISLDGEPGNATIADDVLIAAVRVQTGRDIVAHSLTTGAKLWSLPAPWTYAVRCADDRHAPCFALTRAADGYDQLRTIDPKTGAIGDKVLTSGPIEDLAVNAAGDRIALASRGGPLREVSPDGTELAQYPSDLTTVRSVAYDRSGGFLVAGTIVRNVFQVGRLADGKLTVIVQAENDLLSLVRPSSDGRRIIMHARIYAPVLWEMPL